MDPEKVLGFLDLAGAWDPSLAFVLAGAVGVSALGYAVKARMERPLLAPRFEVPANRRPDARLLSGAALFGIGWGLAGFCPARPWPAWLPAWLSACRRSPCSSRRCWPACSSIA